MEILYTALATICVLLLGVLLDGRMKYWRYRLPPGPTGWPILGCLPSLTENLHLDMVKLGQEYGSVFSVYFGTRLSIVLNGIDAVREAYVNKGLVFAGRPDEPHIIELNPERSGMLYMTYSEAWRGEKKAIVRALKAFDYGSASLESKILLQIDMMKEEINLGLGKRQDICKLASFTMSNTMSSILFGTEYKYNDEEFNNFLKNSAIFVYHHARLMGDLNYLPFQRFLPKTIKRIAQCRKPYDKMMEFFLKHINHHKATKQDNICRDFTDVIIEEAIKQNSALPDWNDEKFCYTLDSLFVDAVDTSPVQFHWLLLYVHYFDNVADRIHNEIEEVIGERQPALKDKDRMPYTEAVIFETFRVSSVVPLATTHCAMEDTKLFGYDIPEGVDVFANLWNVHHDPDVWGDPDVFRPERFIKDGKCVRHEALIPFSMGRRACIGEQLAKKQIFLLLTSLLQQYKFHLDDKPTSLKGEFSIALVPPPFTLRVEQRLVE
ncbi:unnamed protein product [Owenia fusiformis]|uniref:Uncharacterized protein n=1 Tax=Owenia fusiformis TaxID=6347 RepID=A0A8J1UG70_OWEFU|nr:unnamed protein product [Owenia fusiformis]